MKFEELESYVEEGKDFYLNSELKMNEDHNTFFADKYLASHYDTYLNISYKDMISDSWFVIDDDD